MDCTNHCGKNKFHRHTVAVEPCTDRYTPCNTGSCGKSGTTHPSMYHRHCGHHLLLALHQTCIHRTLFQHKQEFHIHKDGLYNKGSTVHRHQLTSSLISSWIWVFCPRRSPGRPGEETNSHPDDISSRICMLWVLTGCLSELSENHWWTSCQETLDPLNELQEETRK